jgi:anti-sigma-K factor RskA
VGGARRPAELPRPAPGRSWAWALAAVLALVTLGLGGWSFLLQRDLQASRDEVAKLRRRASELVAQLAGAQGGPEHAALAGRMQEMEGQLSLVTASGTLVCPLKPSPGAPTSDATGVLFVGADHQHWYLRAQKLAALPADRVYQLWFLVGDQPVRSGAFTLSGEEGVLASPTMPHGTSAAMVTIEPMGSAGERPSGPVVLYGRNMAPLV